MNASTPFDQHFNALNQCLKAFIALKYLTSIALADVNNDAIFIEYWYLIFDSNIVIVGVTVKQSVDLIVIAKYANVLLCIRCDLLTWNQDIVIVTVIVQTSEGNKHPIAI